MNIQSISKENANATPNGGISIGGLLGTEDFIGATISSNNTKKHM